MTLKLQYFGHLMQRANSLRKTLMLGKIEGKKRRGSQRVRHELGPEQQRYCPNWYSTSQLHVELVDNINS